MANYVIANNDYLTDGYVDASFVGTDSDLYVTAGYTTDAIKGEATLSSAASLSVNGGKLLLGTINVSSAITMSVDADTTAVGATIPAGTFTTTVDADTTLVGTSNVSTSVTTTVDADTTLVGTSNVSTNVTTSTDADAILDGVVSLSPAFTTGVTANAIVSPGGDISVIATTTTTAQSNLTGVIDIRAIQEEDITWGDAQDFAWDDRSSDIYWGPNVHIDGSAFTEGTGSSSSSFNLAVDGDTTAVANITPAGIFTVDANASFSVLASANISTSTAVTVSGDLNVVSQNIQISSTTGFTARGIFQVGSGPIALSSSGALAIDGDVIRSGVATPQANVTLQATPSRTKRFVANLTSSFNVSTTASSTSDATVIQAGVFTLTANGDNIANAGAINISSEFTVPRWVGGKLFGGIVNITAFTTQVSALTIYIIDPFRVYTIDSESRLLGIVEETRIYTPNSETRVNSIIEEIREFNVPSETRTLKTQYKKLVEVAGDPLDRRE